MQNSNLWLVGMVRGRRDIMEKCLNDVSHYFDGCVFVVDSRASQEDIKWLELKKGNGEIIVSDWVWDHAWSMSKILFSKVINHNDYCLIMDETDYVNPVFAKDLRESCKYWKRNSVGCVYIDRPLVFSYNLGVRFVESPHWGITGTFGRNLDIKSVQGYRKENYIINNRNFVDSAFLHPSKYYYSYWHSNHLKLIYLQFGQEVYFQHENLRLQFLVFCKEILGLEPNLDSLVNYMKENLGKYPQFFEEMLNLEVNLKDLFRLKVLNQSPQDVENNRHNWDFFRYKNTEKVLQGKDDGYVGVFNKYLLQKGEKTQ